MACVNSVKVYPTELTLKEGQWYYDMSAEVSSIPGTFSNVIWRSSNTCVATVNETSGYVYAKSAGTATIYATATDGSCETGGCTVTVQKKINVNTITLSKTNITLEKNKTAAITANVLPTNADNKSLIWKSSNTCVASVNNGIICGVSEGTAEITVTAADSSGTVAKCTVDVKNEILVTSVTVSPTVKKLAVGESVYLTVSLTPDNSTNKSVNWHSEDENIAVVNPSSGLVSAKRVGETNIYAVAADGSGKQGFCTLKIEPRIPVESIKICTNCTQVNVGDSIHLCATVYPVSATNKSIRWSSCNPNIARVDAYTGCVKGVMAGMVTIQARSVDGNIVACCSVSVSQVLNYPDNLIDHEATVKSMIQLKNMRDEVTVAFMDGRINSDAKEKAYKEIDYEMDLLRADYIAVGENPFSDYAYAVLGGDKNAVIPCAFKRNLYYCEDSPFEGLDVMIVQRVMELYKVYEHDSDKKYGTWDIETHEAALNWGFFLSVTDEKKRVFDAVSYNVLFDSLNISERTYDALFFLRKFSLQHAIVQKMCESSLLLSGNTVRMEMPIDGGSRLGNRGRADLVSATTGGTYIWEVKHNSNNAISVGDNQIQRYINAAKTKSQSAFQPVSNDSKYSLPLIPGPAIFTPTAVPWFNKFLLYKSYSSLNPYKNALIVYEESDSIPNGYVFLPSPVAVEVPEPKSNYSFSLTGAYDLLTNFGNSVVQSLEIDPETGEIIVCVFVAGVMMAIVLSQFVGLLVA